MAHVNEYFQKLSDNYLFADIAKRVSAFKAQHPQANVISLGIGDVTQPLCPTVIDALHRAAEEMANTSSFRGYGPEQGYDFLRKAILEGDFLPHGVRLDADEIFINDGAKSDTGNFQELLHTDNCIAVTDPVYPVYIDANMMAGRKIVSLPCTVASGFAPEIPQEHVDVIYLCYPNNPTGTVLTREQLSRWVAYALQNDALIFYDVAYEAYIQHADIPHSIYEIEGARQCAVEFHSFSKTAGFTGIRCGYTVVPKEVMATTATGKPIALNHLWNRRQCTKFNGASYISQRAAEAIYSPEGREQVRSTIGYYMENARMMRETLQALGLRVWGGEDAPYLWLQTPNGMKSWEFFEQMLHKAHVVCTPGVGFGAMGEGYVRLTAFGRREQTEEAISRIKTI